MTKTTLTDQKQLNEDMTTLGVGRYRSKVETAKTREAELETSYGQRLMRATLPKYAEAIRVYLDGIKNRPDHRGGKNKARYQADMITLKPELVSFIGIKAILDCISVKKTMAKASLFLGSRIEDELRCKFLIAENPTKGGGIILGASRKKGKIRPARHVKNSIKREADKGLMTPWDAWSHADKLNAGLNLIELMRVSTGLIEYIYVLEKANKRPVRYVAATKETLEWIDNYGQDRELMEPFWLPTLELPIDWASVWEGGYDIEGTTLPSLPFIKTPNMEYLRSIKGSLKIPMEACNLIQRTPWRINPFLHDTAEWAWENNLLIGSMPNREEEPFPDLPKDFHTDPEVNSKWRRFLGTIYKSNLSSRGRRVLISKIFYIANKFKDSRFFYPSQADFRGRIYNVPSFLEIQASDVSRGLLMFGRGERINTDAKAYWLGIHGANTWGNDKVSLDARWQWAMDYRKTAQKIAASPKTNLEWTEAEDPFQFLAWCREWSEYTTKGSFESFLPVSVDATNNGLQILSLLMRDEHGAASTNVTPTEIPADIYGVVADLVIEKLKVSDNIFAPMWLKFGIDRKLTKRPTMVWPYGGTLYSCRSYVDDWFRGVVEKTKVNPFGDDGFKATSFLAGLTWSCINEVLDKPKQAMSWLQEVSRTITKTGAPISWVTPSGFPVVQDYKKLKDSKVCTHIGGKGVHIKWYKSLDELSPKKNAQAISPNFVHSLDAAALHLSVYNANKEYGINDFSMIHDSYGTHSNKCDDFGKVLRNVFSSMFSVDLLADLRHQLGDQLPDLVLPPLPDYGSLDPTLIKQSKYFFS
jgi:DNA-directed RNA polymerase, mitochondrial